MPNPNWKAHQYGGGESLTLAPGLVLSVDLSCIRSENAEPWRWTAWGLRGKKPFKTSTEAKESAERFARKTLAAGLAALG